MVSDEVAFLYLGLLSPGESNREDWNQTTVDPACLQVIMGGVIERRKTKKKTNEEREPDVIGYFPIC
jgi:hypothetical protein